LIDSSSRKQTTRQRQRQPGMHDKNTDCRHRGGRCWKLLEESQLSWLSRRSYRHQSTVSVWLSAELSPCPPWIVHHSSTHNQPRHLRIICHQHPVTRQRRVIACIKDRPHSWPTRARKSSLCRLWISCYGHSGSVTRSFPQHEYRLTAPKHIILKTKFMESGVNQSILVPVYIVVPHALDLHV